MKKAITITLAFFICLGFVFAHSGDTINVPLGTSPTIDGILSAGEWSDASTVQIPNIDGTIYFKRSETHLYVAFSDLYGMYFHSTGIYLDLLHDGGTAPKEDDLWIHGSAGPFEFFGNDTAWQSSTPSGWIYLDNSINEYEISLSKLGVVSNTTIGVLFSFLDWSNGYEKTWPSGGYSNCSNPESWANMNISFAPEMIESHDQRNEILVSPNPSSSFTNIHFSNPRNESYSLIITNVNGQILQIIENITGSDKIIDTNNLERGIYFIQLQNKKGVVSRNKFVIE